MHKIVNKQFNQPLVVGVPVNLGVPVIFGPAQVGAISIATNGTWSNVPTSFTYQWNRAGTPIGGAVASTYAPIAADVGNTLTISIIATNGSGSSSAATSLATSAVTNPNIPTIITVPTITGTAQVGQTLTVATNGTWSNNPISFTYQWNRAGTPIGGAVASTYIPVAADVGNTLTVSVVATNGAGSSTAATSAATASVITGAIPTNLTVPTILGTAKVSQTLTSTNGTWANVPTSFTYQWSRAGTPIGGATASSYIPVAADVGNTLTLSVVATNGAGSSTAAISLPTSVVDVSIPVNMAVPTITGTAQVGQTLTALNGTWSNNPTSFTYQWNSIAAPISIPAILTSPTIAGTAQVGQTLTVSSNGTWSNNPTSFAYQWIRAGTPIGGATATTYVPIAADVGNVLTVAVTASNTSGSSTPASSAATAAVIDIIPTIITIPTISGTAQVNQTLTVSSNGTWTHNPASFTYQWKRAGVAIGGATASTYALVSADVGNTMTVAVTASNSGGSSAPSTSAATAAVTAQPGVSLATYGGDWVAAMNAAPGAGNLLIVPAGTWNITQVRPYSGLTIRGAGQATTFVQRNAPGTHTDGGIFKVTVPNVTITDMTVIGYPVASGLSDDMGVNGIGSPTNLTVQRCTFRDMQGIGIQTESAAGFSTGALFEDLTFTNIMFRYNGAHGVALWIYKGTSNGTYRRITINGSLSAGIAIDAGTTGDTDARSNNNNVFQNITISNTGGTLGGVLITGGQNNTFTTISISNITTGGPAFAIGTDQSGLTSNGNYIKTVTLSNITGGDLVWGGSPACGNTFDGVVGGPWTMSAGSGGGCNTFINSPGVVVR